jgi:hypothetical protein
VPGEVCAIDLVPFELNRSSLHSDNCINTVVTLDLAFARGSTVGGGENSQVAWDEKKYGLSGHRLQLWLLHGRVPVVVCHQHQAVRQSHRGYRCIGERKGLDSTRKLIPKPPCAAGDHACEGACPCKLR